MEQNSNVRPAVFDPEHYPEDLELQEHLVPCKGCGVLIRKVPGLDNVCAECLQK